jgi:hypothetical protein
MFQIRTYFFNGLLAIWFFTNGKLQNISEKRSATWCQFHQHFMSSFCAKLLSFKNLQTEIVST